MAEYDLGRMQEEAARRAREMQARARIPHPAGRQPPREPPREEPQEPPPPPQEPPQAEAPAPAAPASPLEALLRDKERTLILALLVLLAGEDGNQELLFALLFLLL